MTRRAVHNSMVKERWWSMSVVEPTMRRPYSTFCGGNHCEFRPLE
jgi:hypothetical protein